MFTAAFENNGCFVFPSKFEEFGIVLIEMQLSGLRCIVSDVIQKEIFQTELAVPVSLKELPEKWEDVILDDSIKGTRIGNFKNKNVVSKVTK